MVGGLTSVSLPAQGLVLPHDAAHGVAVVGQDHGPLGPEALLVVPQQGAVSDAGPWEQREGSARGGPRGPRV